jgi:hypothetical protein
MLFVTSAIRNTCLQSKLRKGESLLQSMAHAWTLATPQLDNCTLIFDDTKTRFAENRFDVISARPNYPTSDDALIDWANKATKEEKEAICIFTSDRALSELLKAAGVTVFKSKKWFQLAAYTMPVEGAEGLDSWADKWLALNCNVNN